MGVSQARARNGTDGVSGCGRGVVLVRFVAAVGMVVTNVGRQVRCGCMKPDNVPTPRF